jgi:lactate dehydrogenase-like 2-hydroxyacid dehydrogenase
MSEPVAPDVWVAIRLKEELVRDLRSRFSIHHALNGLDEALLESRDAAAVRAVVTNGSTGLTAGQMSRLPRLRIVCCFGAGYENVDLAEARSRGIAVTHAPFINNTTVAEHALAMMLALSRGLVVVDAAVRAGKWSASRAERPTMSGKRLGIVGLGGVGSEIARRASAFGMTIGYHARHPRPDVSWRYFPGLVEMARESDYLVAACPGGGATEHLIDAGVLAALGPEGFLVNVARGSVVDTEALIAALSSEGIAGAALDVVEGEPEVPAALLAFDNVILTPHMAGRSPEASRAQFDLLVANLEACFSGEPPVTPVEDGAPGPSRQDR